jgi:hypothetical protein
MTHTEAVRTLAVERYLLNEMPEIERFAFEEHYFDCADCAEDVRAAAAMRDGIKAGPLADAIPAAGPVVPFLPARPANRWRPAIALPWAAAATLAVALGYQSLGPGGEGARLQVQALTPVTLRPDSRGAIPVVALPPGPGGVTLALDVAGASGDALTYELKAAAGDVVASGRVAAPRPGAPLLLLIPSWTLTPPAQYSLAVRGAADGRLLGEYRFSTTAP